jgi:hypothetical protein
MNGPERLQDQTTYDIHTPVGSETPYIEEIFITPEALIEDNHSALAAENMRRNQEAVLSGKTDTTFTCPDARLIIPNLTEAFVVGMIAAGGNRDQFRILINNRGRSIVNLAHFALPRTEQAVLPISKLKGCGGLEVKDLLEHHLINGNGEDNAVKYVDEEVDHSDPLVQTALAAYKMAQICDTKKPIIAAAENTLTGDIGILAIFVNENGTIKPLYKPGFDPALMYPENYDAQRIYQDGIPFIDPETLPDEFKAAYNYVKAQDEKMERMRKWYPDFEETQKVQNRVKAVLWTTSPRPAHLRFPTLFREPGSLFLVSQARVKDITYEGEYENQIVRVTNDARAQGLEQVNYPISEAVKHVNEPNKAFFGTNTLIIEASDIETAVRNQNEFLNKPWAQEWLQKTPGAQIITLETRGGIIQQYGEYKLYRAA